jgi:hypothetical protein
MSRSVYTPRHAATTAFFHIDDSDWEEYDWNDLYGSILYGLRTRFPSMETAKGWVGNNGRIIAENSLARVVVASYCGLVSVSLCPLDRYLDGDREAGLSFSWCDRATPGFHAVLDARFETFRKLGTFSNGESVYERTAS